MLPHTLSSVHLVLEYLRITDVQFSKGGYSIPHIDDKKLIIESTAFVILPLVEGTVVRDFCMDLHRANAAHSDSLDLCVDAGLLVVDSWKSYTHPT